MHLADVIIGENISANAHPQKRCDHSCGSYPYVQPTITTKTPMLEHSLKGMHSIVIAQGQVGN